MDLDKLEQDFHAAKARCVALQKGLPVNEAEELMQWLLNTDINPYGIFLNDGTANMTQSIQGLDALFDILVHALLDDGAISFVEINQKPNVVFLHPSDFEDDEAFWEAVKKEDSFSGHALFPVERRIMECTVSEFIQACEDHESEFLKSCFMLEARKDLEGTVDKYKGMLRFNPDWIDEVKNQ